MLFNLNIKNLKNTVEDLKSAATEAIDDLTSMLSGLGLDMVVDAAKKWAIRAGAKHVGATTICGGGGAAAGSVVPGAGTAAGAAGGATVCNIAVAIIDVVDAIWTLGSTASNLWSMKDQIGDMAELLTKAKSDAEKILEAADDPKKLEKLKKELADEMKKGALRDRCLKARKCALVPKEKRDKGVDIERKIDKTPEASGAKSISDRLGATLAAAVLGKVDIT